MSDTVQIPLTGYSVEADLYKGTSDEVLLVLIGFESNKAKYREMVELLVEETSTSALVVDYTGHGASPFELQDLRPAQHFLEVITAFDWIADNQPDKKINVMGTSYGGFHATQLTKYRKFEKLILRVPAIYPADFFYTKWKNADTEYIRGTYRQQTGNLIDHPLLKRASSFKGKVLVISHELDIVCPRNVTDAFIAAFQAEAWTQAGFKHSISESAPDQATLSTYYKKIAGWLR